MGPEFPGGERGLVSLPVFKTGAPGDPRWAGSIPVRLRQDRSGGPARPEAVSPAPRVARQLQPPTPRWAGSITVRLRQTLLTFGDSFNCARHIHLRAGLNSAEMSTDCQRSSTIGASKSCDLRRTCPLRTAQRSDSLCDCAGEASGRADRQAQSRRRGWWMPGSDVRLRRSHHSTATKPARW